MPDNSAALSSAISERIKTIKAAITDHSSEPDRVKLIAVSKKFSPEVIEVAYDLGLRDFGENYAQELESKAEVLSALDINWHFIGGLQRNKVKKLADIVSCWHTIDRPQLVSEVAKRSPGASIFIQVNSTDEPQKSGCVLDSVEELVELADASGLIVQGLMTMGPTSETSSHQAFQTVAELNAKLGLDDLSIGMSGDYEMALRLGATHLRLGTAIFGPRI